jgi:diguanylate cyclase (GGDEF)-like protein
MSDASPAAGLHDPHTHGETDSVFRLRALTEFVSVVSAARGYGDLLRLMAVESRRALEAGSVSLSVWERDRGVLRTLVNEGDLGPLQMPSPLDEVYALSDYPLARRMFTEGLGYVMSLDDPDVDERLEEILAGERKHSCLAMPIMLEGRVWGELWATRGEGRPAYTASDLDFARLVAAQVGDGISQAERVARVERLAYTDDLTGLANRRAFEDRLDEALASHRRMGTTVGVVVVDVNGLKRINDNHGHFVGDSALVTFSAELSAAASIFPNSTAARLGGDEFCLLCVGATGDDVVNLAEDVCRRALDVLDEGVACGVATTDDLPTIEVTPARLLRAADAAQYRAKRMGMVVPVVAGRTALPTEGEPVARDRRTFRGRGSLEPAALLDEILHRLDDVPDAPVLHRMAVVAGALAEAVDAASWWISRIDPGTRTVVTAESGIYRRDGGAAYGVNAPDSYPLEEYPATFAAISGHLVMVDVDDPRSDAAETSLLMLAGLAEMGMCGGPDRSGTRWLLEVLGDELSAPMRIYGGVLRAAVSLALTTPSTPDLGG